MNTKPDALNLASVPIFDRGIGWQADATATLKEQAAEIRHLRELLAVRVAGALLYADDGELQDNTQMPCIDFRRDTPSEIQRKLQERGLANSERAAVVEIEKLRSLLARCRLIIEADAQMMADISRHAPLDEASQAAHDATEYESEKLARELECLLGPNAELTGAERQRREGSG